MEIDLEITDTVQDSDRQTIRNGLIEYNLSKFEDADIIRIDT